MGKQEIINKLNSLESKISNLDATTTNITKNGDDFNILPSSTIVSKNTIVEINLNGNYKKGVTKGQEITIIRADGIPNPKIQLRQHILICSNVDGTYKGITININQNGSITANILEAITGPFNIKYNTTYISA